VIYFTENRRAWEGTNEQQKVTSLIDHPNHNIAGWLCWETSSIKSNWHIDDSIPQQYAYRNTSTY
jgi:hypothetical protein